jgi:hypothetical protein
MVNIETKKKFLNRDFYHEFITLSVVIFNKEEMSDLSLSDHLDGRNVSKSIWWESVLVHFRNILEFFYNDNSQNHALAQDFLVEGINWRDIREIPQVYTEVYSDICARLSHLSYDRTKENIDFNKYQILFDDIIKKTKLFLEKIDKQYEDTEILKLKKSLKDISKTNKE